MCWPLWPAHKRHYTVRNGQMLKLRDKLSLLLIIVLIIFTLFFFKKNIVIEVPDNSVPVVRLARSAQFGPGGFQGMCTFWVVINMSNRFPRIFK